MQAPSGGEGLALASTSYQYQYYVDLGFVTEVIVPTRTGTSATILAFNHSFQIFDKYSEEDVCYII